jgi:hypothetical protein
MPASRSWGSLLRFASVSLLSAFLFLIACNKKDNPVSSHGPSNLPRGEGWTFTKTSGDLQTARIHDTLTNRLVTSLKDANGVAVVYEPVTISLLQGNGQVVVKLSPNSTDEIRTITDNHGLTSANFQFFGDNGGLGTMLVRFQVDSFPTLTQTFTIYPPH